MRTSKPISVTLGALQERVDARVNSGAYASASDVLRAGLRAMDREEAAIDAFLRRKVQEALDEHAPRSQQTRSSPRCARRSRAIAV